MTLSPHGAGGELEGGFSRRVLGWAIGIAVASFLGALLLSAWGGGAAPPTPDTNSFSYSAIGHRALAEYLRALGLGVVSRQARGALGIGPGRPLVLAEPDAGRLFHRIGIRRSEARGSDAVLVLVLPKWQGEPHTGVPGWIRHASRRSDSDVAAALEGLADPALRALRVQRGKASSCTADAGATATAPGSNRQVPQRRFTLDAATVQLLTGPGVLEPVVACDGGGILIGRRLLGDGGPELYVVSDPDVLNNQGLARGDHAALVHHLFVERLRAKGVVFDETIHGFVRSESLLAEAFRFPLLPAVLQGFVLLGIVLWAGMGRFGKPLPAAPALAAGKEVLIANTAALLAAGGHALESLARYHRQTLRAVAAACFLPAALPEPELRRRLEELSRQRGAATNLGFLHHQLDRLEPGPEAARRALALAARLDRWRREMTDGHRAHP